MVELVRTRRACTYARFSSDLQNDRSIDDQVAMLLPHAELEGMAVTKTYSDRAKSGATMFERDGLQQLIVDAAAKKFDVVLVESLDRLSRDQADLAYLFKHLSFHQVDIVTHNEGTATPLHIGIRGLLGQLFLTDLSAKVKRGLNGRAREGKIPGGALYGYRPVAGKPGEREIYEPEAEVVRRIFREYVAGASPRAIAKGLTADAIPSPSGRSHWNFFTLTSGNLCGGIIGNALYKGVLIYNRYRVVTNPATGKKTKRPADAKDLIVTPVPHLQIVDADTWAEANRIRKARAVEQFGPGGRFRQRPVVARGDYALSGLLRCGECGGHMRLAGRSAKGSRRIICSAAVESGACDHRRVYSLDIMQAFIATEFQKRLSDPEAVCEMMKAYAKEFAATEKANRGERTKVVARLKQIEGKVARLTAAILDLDAGPVAELTAQLKPLHVERGQLESRLRILEAQANVITLHPDVARSFTHKVNRLHAALTNEGTLAAARGAVRELIEYIVVHKVGRKQRYEITPYTRLGTLMGVDLLPACEETAPIQCVASAAESCALPRARLNSTSVISLGAWRAAA